MKMHAGSLYKDWLILYGKNLTPICVQFTSATTQWEIYCNDVEVELENSYTTKVVYKNWELRLPYIQTDNPMKALRFA